MGDDLGVFGTHGSLAQGVAGFGKGVEVAGQFHHSRGGGAAGVGVPGNPGAGIQQTGTRRDIGCFSGRDDLEFEPFQPPDRPIRLPQQAMQPTTTSGPGESVRLEGEQPVQQPVQLPQHPRNRPHLHRPAPHERVVQLRRRKRDGHRRLLRELEHHPFKQALP